MRRSRILPDRPGAVGCHHLRVLAALGRGIARRPGLIVLVWLLATIAGFAAATGVFGEGLFARLEAGEPTVSSESSRGPRDPQRGEHHRTVAEPDRAERRPGGPGPGRPLTAARADLVAIPGMATRRRPAARSRRAQARRPRPG